MPADTINFEASSKLISRYTTSSFGNISKKPLVGLGVVGTKTLTNLVLVFFEISPLLSLVAKPTAQLPFLGYSTRTTLFLFFFSWSQSFGHLSQSRIYSP